MFARRSLAVFQSSLTRVTRSNHSSAHHHGPIGFIGLGNMGSKMVKNFAEDGHSVIVYDRSNDAVQSVVSANKDKVSAGSVDKIGKSCTVVFTMLPNDNIVEDISSQLLAASGPDQHKKVHVSCSTISPELAKRLTKKHLDSGFHFVSSPVFARPDGIDRRQAIWMLSGHVEGKSVATKFLSKVGKIEDFGEETGAANVVKLCGNFLIAVS
jgi:3-hydroxyisobutyrate dehydrogenase-like beta-hydroxyacid dehydrogenase